MKAHFIVGNPPWASVKDKNAPAVRWCIEQKVPFQTTRLRPHLFGKLRIRCRKTGKSASFSHTARYSTTVQLRLCSNKRGCGNTLWN